MLSTQRWLPGFTSYANILGESLLMPVLKCYLISLRLCITLKLYHGVKRYVNQAILVNKDSLYLKDVERLLGECSCCWRKFRFLFWYTYTLNVLKGALMTFTHELCPLYRMSVKELKAYIRASQWTNVFESKLYCHLLPRAVSNHDQKCNYNYK